MAEPVDIVVQAQEDATYVVEVSPSGTPGVGVIPGGTTDQVLAKNSNASYDFKWVTSGAGAGTVTDVDLSNIGITFTGPIAGVLTGTVADGGTAGRSALAVTYANLPDPPNLVADAPSDTVQYARQSPTVGGAVVWTPVAVGGLLLGITPIPNGDDQRILYQNGGYLGELTLGTSLTITAEVLDIVDPPIFIGRPVTGSAGNRVLFTDAGPNLAESTALTFDGTTLHATIFNGDGTGITALPASGIINYPADGTKYLSGDGTWTTPAGGGSGDVVGPASSVSGKVAVFGDTTGKLLADGGTLGSAAFVAASAFDAAGAAAAITLSGLGGVPTTRTVNGHALSGNVTVTASDVSLGSVTNAAQTLASVVPNTLPSAGQVLVGNAGGTAYAPVSLSGKVTITSAGVASVSLASGDIPNNAANTTGSAATLTTPRTINGTSFDGSANITVTAAGSTLSDTVPVANGGTGLTTITANSVLLGNGTSAVALVAPSTSGNVLTSNGTTWQSTALSVPATSITGTLGVLHGGTGLTGFVVGDLLVANATAGIATIAAAATGNALLAIGAGIVPVYGKVTTAYTTGIAASGANTDITSLTLAGALSNVYAGTTAVTTASGIALSANSLTTGTGFYAASSTLTSGLLMDLQVSGTAAAAGQVALNVACVGANGSSGITTTGAKISNTHTGTTSTNVALTLTASGGATANTALNITAGDIMQSSSYGISCTGIAPPGATLNGYTIRLGGSVIVSNVSSGYQFGDAGTKMNLASGSAVIGIGGYTSSFPAIKRSSATILFRLGDDSADCDITAARVISTNVIRLKTYTVATLPSGTTGDTAAVTDSLAPAFGVIIAGGGAAYSIVSYNGTNWVAF